MFEDMTDSIWLGHGLRMENPPAAVVVPPEVKYHDIWSTEKRAHFNSLMKSDSGQNGVTTFSEKTPEDSALNGASYFHLPFDADVFSSTDVPDSELGQELVYGDIDAARKQYGKDYNYQIDAEFEHLKTKTHLCEYKWKGQVPEKERALSTCDAPVYFRCIYCPESFQAVCKSTDASKCAKCEHRYRVRVRSVARMPMLAALPSSVYIMTLTAPGSKKHCLAHTYKDKKGKTQPGVRCETVLAPNANGILDWVLASPDCQECPCSINSKPVHKSLEGKAHCLSHATKTKSGKDIPATDCEKVYAVNSAGEVKLALNINTCQECPCSLAPEDFQDAIANFNASLAKLWNRFMTYMKRYSPDGVTGRGNKGTRPFEAFEYFKAIEPQERGALHIHALIRSPRPFAMTPDVFDALKMIALDLGFGHQFDIQTIGQGLDSVTAARYVAKYVSKRNSSTEKEIPYPRYKDEYHLTVSHTEKDGDTSFVEKIRKKIKLPRAWTVSRKWGLTLSKLIEQQKMFFVDKNKARELMADYMYEIQKIQSGLPTFRKYQLAIEA